jgi:hypothetical protein
MTEKLEAQIIEAFKKADVFGDIAPDHGRDPMTMILRERALQDDLMRWGRASTLSEVARGLRPLLPAPGNNSPRSSAAFRSFS